MLNSHETFKELSIELTHRCSLACIYCSSNANIRQTAEIDFERIKHIIAEVKHIFGVNTISLSGGETFLYSHFSDLYEFLSSQDLRILIYTSGIQLDHNGNMVPISREFIQNIYINRDNPSFLLNIQGHDEVLIEEINKVSGSYKIIEESIKNIIAEGMTLGAHSALQEKLPIFKGDCGILSS